VRVRVSLWAPYFIFLLRFISIRPLGQYVLGEQFLPETFMKKKIHPLSHMIKITCSCGNSFDFLTASKEKEMRVEICSACHPFYTGEQKILKTGAVDKFYARQKKTEEKKSETPKKK
jgi:large subunit ribosomal protein L31